MTLKDYIKENLTIDIDGIIENIYEIFFIVNKQEDSHLFR